MSSDFGKLKSIIEILTPGLVFAVDGRAFARAIDAAVPIDVEIVVTANPPGSAATTHFADFARARADRGGGGGACQSRARDDRKNPVHLRLDRQPKGVINTQRMLCANQAHDPRRPRLRRRRAAGDRRLAAVEPHLRQQPQFQSRARQRRLALYRRGQADCPARSRRPCATCARSRRRSTSTCRRATRRCCRICAPTRRCAETSSAA